MSNQEILKSLREQNLIPGERFDERAATVSLCFYYIDVLKTEGIMEGGPFSISDKGQDVSKHLIDAGFKIKLDEVLGFIMSIRDHFDGVSLEDLFAFSSTLVRMNETGVPTFLKEWNEFKEAFD